MSGLELAIEDKKAGRAISVANRIPIHSAPDRQSRLIPGRFIQFSIQYVLQCAVCREWNCHTSVVIDFDNKVRSVGCILQL